ncbi:MAG TPA: TolC family outer membrane protein [Solimonas sp.]|nr:TolC family outer membrane protein [Solimonas sp.]
MRFIRGLLCASALAAPAAQAKELLQVYELARQNDTVVHAAEFARDAAVEVRPQARALLLPQISGTYGYNKTHEKGTQEAFGSPAAPFDSRGTNDGLTVTLNQSVFNWEYWRRLSQSSDQVALAQTNYRAAEQNLVLRSADAYFNVLSAADALRSAEAENQAVQRQLEQANKRFEVGLSAITDTQEAQARYDLTVATVIEARQLLDSAKLALAEITGTAANPIAPLQDDFPLPAPSPADVNAWIGSAGERNLDLVASRLIADIADKEVDVAWARHLPTVGAQAQYGDATSSNSFRSADSKSDSYGIQVNVPIFAGGATQSQVRQARATREQRITELEGRRRLVERQTRDAYQGVLASAARVKALKQAVLSNTTAMDASETGLQVGARTAVDVLNAQQLLYVAQRNYYRSRYDYLLAVLRLKAAAGKLGVDDLAEIDRLLVQS